MGKIDVAPERLESYAMNDRVYHCALDDTIDVLEEINRKADDLQSIFDVPVMAQIKEFHEQYGAKFSLYLFYEKIGGFNLSQMTDKFIDEWEANSDWLRLSFHARTKHPEICEYYLYNNLDYQTAKEDFQMIKKEILRFAGVESWDNYPRTHFWSGNRETVKAWRDCGVDGLFFSYRGYPALYFDDEQLEKLWNKDYWVDPEMKLLFITTNVKLPCLTVDEVKKDLAALAHRKIIEIFADDYNLIELKEHMETAIRWANENGFKPAFYDEVFSHSIIKAV
jgi:hypothetical protein